MDSNSENGASNAFGVGLFSGCTLNFNFVVLMIIYFISVMICLDGQDHIVAMPWINMCNHDNFVHTVYELVVMLVTMIYKMIILAGMIYNSIMSCSHVLNHNVMTYLRIYGYIIAMLNYLYVIIFMRLFSKLI